MAAIPEAKQRLIVTGELAIDGSAGYQASTALINFNTKVVNRYVDLAQIRCFGGFGNYTLLLDGSGSNGGVVVRASANEGDSYYLPTAKGDQYALKVLSNTGQTVIKQLAVQVESTQFKSTFDGAPLLSVIKPNTTLASTLRNTIANITLQNWRQGETVDVELGNGYSGSVLWSYTTPDSTSSSDTKNYGSLSMKRLGVIVDNIKLYTDGSVEIPVELKAGIVQATTINATTYENLPPFDPTNLLPLTLDNVDKKVGINNIDPQFDLDVVGDGAFTASLTARDLVLSGSGNAQILGGTASPEGTKTAPPGSLYLRTDGGVNSTLYVKQAGTGNTGWTAFGSFDPLPLTLDKVNNRVGINNTSPATDLHVVGATTTTTINVSNLRGYYLNNSLFMSSRNSGSVAIGDFAGGISSTPDVTTDQKVYAVAIGQNAGTRNQGIRAVGVGQYAGSSNQGENAVAIGNSAGGNNQGVDGVAIGTYTSHMGSGANAIAIGKFAGRNAHAANSIILNATGVELNSDGTNRFFVKPVRNENNVQSSLMQYNATTGEITYGFPGYAAGSTAIGQQAGWGGGTNIKQSANSTAVGYLAGATEQGVSTVSIGEQAARYVQKPNAIAIGSFAGTTNQSNNAIAIGASAGRNNQPQNSVAIGYLAAQNTTGENCIVLNATGAVLNTLSTQTNSFFVKPIRNLINESLPLLSYNATTGEICYGDSTTTSMLPITLDKVNTRVGINNTTPTTALDVTGTITATNVAGTLTTAAQPNITSVGTLGSLGVTGAISTGTLSLQAIANTTKPNVLYYDSTTKDVTYGSPPTTPPFTPFSPIVTNTVANGESADGTYRQYCNQTIGPGLFSVKALISWGSLGVGGSAVFLQRIKSTVPTIYVEKTGSYSGTTNEEFLSGTIYLTNTETVGVEIQRSGGSGIVNIKFQVIQINNY